MAHLATPVLSIALPGHVQLFHTASPASVTRYALQQVSLSHYVVGKNHAAGAGTFQDSPCLSALPSFYVLLLLFVIKASRSNNTGIIMHHLCFVNETKEDGQVV